MFYCHICLNSTHSTSVQPLVSAPQVMSSYQLHLCRYHLQNFSTPIDGTKWNTWAVQRRWIYYVNITHFKAQSGITTPKTEWQNKEPNNNISTISCICFLTCTIMHCALDLIHLLKQTHLFVPLVHPTSYTYRAKVNPSNSLPSTLEQRAPVQ